jgi:hypothetical protein
MMGGFIRVTEQGGEEADCVDEGAVVMSNDEVDGVEVFAATEASGEVGQGVNGGVELGADRAKEAEVSLWVFCRDEKDGLDDEVNWNVVPELEEEIVAETFWHGILPWLGELEFSHGVEAALMRAAVAMELMSLGMPPE